MPSTSGTFNFQSIQIELIIREAFERLGILGEFVEPQKLDSAKRSIDLLLLEWMNKSINLWTLNTAYLPLQTGQAQYILPKIVNKVIQANLRTSTRILNGVAASSANGNADNAFDGNPSTACTQNAPDGNISYDYGQNVTQNITFIGIQSNSTTEYSIVVEYSQDIMHWFPLLVIESQIFTIGINKWFDVPTPINARAYRIRETGGATLDIQEIYFNNNVLDFAVSGISRYDYLTYPNKYLQSRPTTYYFNRQITPILTIYPTPSPQYNCLLYSYTQMMEDAGILYTNALEIPSRFYPALIWGLSWHLALKYKPEAAAMFKNEYDQSFNAAIIEDAEGAAIRIDVDYSSESDL